MFLYTEGGPDHRLTYLSVQLSLISLFLKLDLDLLCACRTAPFHSWRNPVERTMSILNLGFQSIGLMRKQVEEKFESTISKCNNMKQLRAATEKKPELVDVDAHRTRLALQWCRKKATRFRVDERRKVITIFFLTRAVGHRSSFRSLE